ncbi:ImmA/IrrE family metallo-endopeptidase [Glaciimonas sp. CA11.2]|nr:ImmA/IrrE family metallo-endopeptidase [Glaciimonas sp. CA11.2]MDY7545034.1 ImmA/IrrE family metallo-endopeptidase [Glaciimonas sp. CA11.2]
MDELKLKSATQFAEKLVKDAGLQFPIDILSIAQERNILVAAKPASSKGVSGMLIRSGNDFAIAYATHIKSEGFQRFSIAHELGHYFLDGHPEEVFRNGATMHESKAGFGTVDQIELEADHFAAGLHMPSHLFNAATAKFSDGLEAVQGLAKLCNTSLTAAAIRYAELAEAAVAIVLSHGQTVDYCFSSESMRRIKGYRHLKKGVLLPKNTTTSNFNKHPENIASGLEMSDSTDPSIWFHIDDEIDSSEEVIGLGEYGRTLTVITAEIPDEDEEN